MVQERLLLVLAYLGIKYLQTRTKLQQALKGVLNCCKLEIIIKCQTRLSNSCSYKDPIPKDLISVLDHESKKYLLEIKESLLIMRDKPSLNRNIYSASLYLFYTVS